VGTREQNDNNLDNGLAGSLCIRLLFALGESMNEEQDKSWANIAKMQTNIDEMLAENEQDTLKWKKEMRRGKYILNGLFALFIIILVGGTGYLCYGLYNISNMWHEMAVEIHQTTQQMRQDLEDIERNL
jgi:hypothetical protein